MAKIKIFRAFTDNLSTTFRKIIFHEISPKSFSQDFLVIFKFFPKLTENFPKRNRSHVLSKYFSEFYNFPKFSENFETILVNRRFEFCLAAESIGQDGAILPDDQPIKL